MRQNLVRRVLYHYIPHRDRIGNGRPGKWEVVIKFGVVVFVEDEMDGRGRRVLNGEARAVLRIEVGAFLPYIVSACLRQQR